MFHIYLVRRDDKYTIRFINSYVSSTGIKSSGVLAESRISRTSIDMTVEKANNLIDALINAGMPVEPSLGLAEELEKITTARIELEQKD